MFYSKRYPMYLLYFSCLYFRFIFYYYCLSPNTGKKIEELILYLMKVQDRLVLPDIDKYNEGNLGILQSEIYKLVVLLSEQSHTAKKERVFSQDAF